MLSFVAYYNPMFVYLFQGKVLIQGTYEDIMASGFDLMGLVASPENEESTAPEEAKRRASNHEQLIKSDIVSHCLVSLYQFYKKWILEVICYYYLLRNLKKDILSKKKKQRLKEK